MNEIILGVGICKICNSIQDITRMDITDNEAIVLTLKCNHRAILGFVKWIQPKEEQ